MSCCIKQPLNVQGKGMLTKFTVNGKCLREVVAWNRHCVITSRQLVVDGVVFAKWEPDDSFTYIYDDPNDVSSWTSDESL